MHTRINFVEGDEAFFKIPMISFPITLHTHVIILKNTFYKRIVSYAHSYLTSTNTQTHTQTHTHVLGVEVDDDRGLSRDSVDKIGIFVINSN